jgi:hypothetical protein
MTADAGGTGVHDGTSVTVVTWQAVGYHRV